MNFSYCLLSRVFTRLMCEIRSYLNRGILDLVMSPSQNEISKEMMKKWDSWETMIKKSRNPRMLQQLTWHSQQIIKATSTQDLDPRPLANHDHPSILPFEMYTIEPGETPSHILKWSPLGFLSHIKRRTIGDRFPLSLWEVWFCSTVGVAIPALIDPSHRCVWNAVDYDVCGDHLQTCQVKSAGTRGKKNQPYLKNPSKFSKLLSFIVFESFITVILIYKSCL